MAQLLNDPDNMAPAYMQRAQSSELQNLLKDSQMFAQSTGASPVAKVEEVDPADPKGISVKGVLKDLGTGLIEGIPQAAGGVLEGVQEVLESMDSIADYLNENVLDTTLPGVGKDDMELNLPQVGAAKSVTGNVIRKASQFLTSFIPTLQAIKRTTGVAKGVGYIAQVTGAGAITDAFAFDPHEERLSNLAKDMGIETQLTDYLAADPSDSEAEGRFKNAVEGTGLGVITDGIFHAAKGIRAWHLSRGTQPRMEGEGILVSGKNVPGEAPIVRFQKDAEIIQKALPAPEEGTVRLWRGNRPDEVGKATRFTNDLPGIALPFREGYKGDLSYVDVPKAQLKQLEDKTGAAPGAEFTLPKEIAETAKPVKVKTAVEVPAFQSALIKSEPKRAFITDPKVVDKVTEGKATPDDLAKALDFSQLNSPEMIAKAVNRFAKISTEANTLAKGPKNMGRPPVVSDKEIAKLADELNMTPAQVMGSQAFLKGNKALDAERIHAASKLLEATTIKVTELAEKATTTTDAKDLFDFVKMMHVHSAMQQYFKGASSEAGRALRALQIPNGSLSKQLTMLNEALLTVGGEGGIRKVAEAVKKAKGNKKALRQVLEHSFKKKLSDTVVSLWYFDLLSGFKTHAANIIGTGGQLGIQVPERWLAAKIGKLMNTEQGVAEGEAAALLSGYTKSFGDGLRAMAETWRTGEQFSRASSSRFERDEIARGGAKKWGLDKAPEGDPRWYIGKAFNAMSALLDVPTKAIMSEDEFFRVVAKGGEMEALALRQARAEGLEGKAAQKRMLEIMENPGEDMLAKTGEFMDSVTFSEPLGRFGNALVALTNTHPILKLALPFIRTPVNLLKAVGRRNVITAPFMASVRADIAKGGAAKDLAYARMALGSMVSLVVMDQVLSGNVTGAGPSGIGDKGLQNAWRVNHQPYSIKVPESLFRAVDGITTAGFSELMRDDDGSEYRWVSYNRMDPLGTLLGAVATYTELASNGWDDLDDLAEGIAVATSQTVFNKTWMKGPAELLEALTQPDRYGAKWITQTAGTLLVAQGAAQITQQLDPTWREVNGLLDAVQARVPGLSDGSEALGIKALPPRRNLWGEPIYMEGGLGPDIVSPVYSFGMRQDAISQFITDNKVAIDLPTRTQLNVELKPDEYSRFVELAGTAAHEVLKGMIEGTGPGSEQWKLGTDGPDGSRAAIIKGVIQGTRDEARAKLQREFPELSKRVSEYRQAKVKSFTGK